MFKFKICDSENLFNLFGFFKFDGFSWDNYRIYRTGFPYSLDSILVWCGECEGQSEFNLRVYSLSDKRDGDELEVLEIVKAIVDFIIAYVDNSDLYSSCVDAFKFLIELKSVCSISSVVSFIDDSINSLDFPKFPEFQNF